MTLFSFGQESVQPSVRWTIKSGYSIGTSFALNEPVVFFLCREGCNPVQQRLRIVNQINFSLAFDWNERHKVGLGFGAMYHELEQTFLMNTFNGQVINGYPMEYSFGGLRLFHEVDLFKKGNFEFFLNNGLGYHQYWDNGERYSLKEQVFDYQVLFGIRSMFFKSFGVEVGQYFNTALTPFNLRKYNKNFYPYHFGLNLNLIGRF
jgi:hypothetical protein